MNLIRTLPKMVNKLLLFDHPFEAEIDQNNLRRIIILFYLMVPVHLVHIIIFYQAMAGDSAALDDITTTWRLGIIYAHLAMLILALLAGLLASFLYRKKLDSGSAVRILAAIVAFLYLLFGALVCIIDQLVTSSINPYLISSMAVGLVILLHPYLTLLYYPLIFFFFYYLVPLTQQDSSLITTVRANGVSAAAIGMGLALIVWRTNLMTLTQSKTIDQQKEELVAKNRQLEKMARIDMMTGLNNRMSFTEETEKELARTRRTGNDSTIVLLDLDNIKKINDQYGHPAGDQVLVAVAELIKSQLRSVDLAARFGGDEFALLLPDTDLQGALKVADKVRLAIAKHYFPLDDENLRITASFGVAVLNSGDDQSFNSLYQEADQALYRAKNEGRNRVES